MAAPIVVSASVKHTSTLIFLHGLGDTGQGWSSTMAALKPAHCKLICPTAAIMPVTLNAGYKMPSWFDLKSLDPTGPEDAEGIQTATQLIHGMIDDEIKGGIPSERIVLGGFSQGGALALYSALTLSKRLGGVVCLSGWLPLHKSFPAAFKCGDDLPVLQCHGEHDPIVDIKMGHMTASLLKTILKYPEYKTYSNLQHCSSDEELFDVKQFVSKFLPAV